jgi:hypothetical protein
MSEVTRILSQINDGDPSAAEQLLPFVYDELRKLAAVRPARAKPGQNLQATPMVHGAHARLVDAARVQRRRNRRPFFAATAEVMRRILSDGRSPSRSQQRGTEVLRVTSFLPKGLFYDL